MFSIGFEYRHNGETFIVGMSFNRFWGLYNPNTGAALAVTSIFLCWMLLVMGQKRGRCFYITNIVFQMFYLLLTQSRTAWYTLLIFGGIILFVQLLLRLRQKGKDTKGRVAALLAAVLVAAGGVELLRPVSVAAVSYIPSVITQVKGFIFENGRFSSEDLHPAISERDDSFGSDNTDATNGRVMLWKAGLKAFLKKPVFGVTREALYDEVSPYLAEERMGNLKRGGLHNIYLSVLVCSGLVGFTLLLIFVLGLCRTLLFRRSLVVSRENLWQYLLMVIPFSFFLMELFEARILYRANIFGVVFWLFTGYMMYFAEKDAEKAGGGFRSNWVARIERAVCRLKGKR
jgi:O-antigen ligase